MAKEFDTTVMRQRLKELRGQKELRQSELASLAGITPAALSQIEGGSRTPTLGVVESLANVLGVTLDYLSGRADGSDSKNLLQTQSARELFAGYQSLGPSEQRMILSNIEFLRSKQGDSGKKK